MRRTVIILRTPHLKPTIIYNITSMARKSPRPYWLFVTEAANILGVTRDRAHEAASQVWPDCVEKKEYKEYSLKLKEWRRGTGEETYIPPRITPLTKKYLENVLEYGKVCYWD